MENIDSFYNDPQLAEKNSTDVDILALKQFLKKIDTGKPKKQNKIMVPQELASQETANGKLYGYIREDTGYHSIVGWEGNYPPAELKADCIGYITDDDTSVPANSFTMPYIKGKREKDRMSFVYMTTDESDAPVEIPLTTDIYTLKQDIFSRNSGLIETGMMDDALVFISGCGSVGSLIALQLARSGVGRFILCDTDCVEIHNVCRHQCSLSDVGRYKVDALAERILQINPAAEVNRFYMKVQDIPRDRYDKLITNPKRTVFIGTCDNRLGNAYTSDIAVRYQAPFMALFFMTRAWAFEVFLYLPERNDICYRCAFHSKIEEMQEPTERNLFYVGQEDLKKTTFMPGLDVDLEYGTSLFDKIVLDVINRFHPKYPIHLANHLTQLTMFSGTADRTFSNPFWNRYLPEPLSHAKMKFEDSCRRCESCCKKI